MSSLMIALTVPRRANMSLHKDGHAPFFHVRQQVCGWCPSHVDGFLLVIYAVDLHQPKKLQCSMSATCLKPILKSMSREADLNLIATACVCVGTGDR